MNTGLYIHIPYCLQKCRYCDFFSVAQRENTDAFVSVLHREIELSPSLLPEGTMVPSVFFGGGTPTVLPAEMLAALLTHIKAAFTLQPDAEITLECNPGTAGPEALAVLRKAGFNRLSLGLQSTEDDLLHSIGRIHDYAAFLRAFQAARQAGFANINVDLMHGLPGQSQESYLASLKKVCDLGPEHISAYCLILEEGTPLYGDVQAGRIILPDPDAVADMEDAGMAYLESQGYGRYEISNFARPGYACRHNLLYWNNQPYLGLGPGAHSSLPGKDGWERWYNPANIPGYLRSLNADHLPRGEIQRLSPREERFETVMLGLRKVEGLSLAEFENRFGEKLPAAFPKAFRQIDEYGWWAVCPGRAALNCRGLDMLNEALVLFMEE